MYVRDRTPKRTDGDVDKRRPTFLLRWETRNSGGERRFIYETFHGPKSKAEARWIKRQAEILAEGPAYVAPSKEKLSDYLSSWLQHCAARVQAGELAPSTLRQYEDYARRYLSDLGHVKIAELTPATAQEWVDGLLARGLSPSTVSLARTTLRTALQRAVKQKRLPSNPLDLVDGPRRPQRRRAQALPVEQAEALLKEAYARTQYGPLLEFLWLSGLRPSEALGLRRDAVDLKEGCVCVRRSRVKVGGAMVESDRLKTEAAHRRVDLPKRGVECLRRHLEAAPPSDLVFTQRDGSGLSIDQVDDAFARLRDRLGLPPVRVYDLRHTAATMQMTAGVPLEVVSKRLGHSNVSTTADIYQHLTDEANRAAARKVDKLLSGEE